MTFLGGGDIKVDALYRLIGLNTLLHDAHIDMAYRLKFVLFRI